VKAEIAARIGEVEAAEGARKKIKAIAQAKGKIDDAIAKGKRIVDGIQRIDVKQQARR
jgi:hypothetical protein